MVNKIVFLSSLVFFVLVCVGCRELVYVPVTQIKTVTQIERDTIINVKLERETVFLETKDTLVYAETKYAKATSKWSGSNATLSLDLRNKQVEIPIETKYIERITVDSIPVPYEVEKVVKERYVPGYVNFMRRVGECLSALLLLLLIYLKWKR